MVDFGADYRMKRFIPINVWFSLNVGVMKNNSESYNESEDFKITLYTLQPRVFTELDLKST